MARGVFRRIDIAVADDGHFYGLLDAGDEIPVGAAGYNPGREYGMDGQRLRRRWIRPSWRRRRRRWNFIPAGAEFDGERDTHGGAHNVKNFAEQIEVAEKAGAAALDDFFGRAAEIDVDGVVAEVFHHFAALAMTSGLAPKSCAVMGCSSS